MNSHIDVGNELIVTLIVTPIFHAFLLLHAGIRISIELLAMFVCARYVAYDVRQENLTLLLSLLQMIYIFDSVLFP